ncbi:RnfABCDGE type electron transport complex subunit D [Marinifilum sp. N1E240]|uniref:RnfABCDGE type electron transport complex subunit D n=1 Tax=Marinifilum sp. N1E240 TaxID=2608082 RepID=UPI00128CDF05|nr:RnfABCDGE type electron transport complex subunit D [Marinifilum sp. N1E240]MPQ46066.1 RnfABCDGE type electron transport complex subunit D [Marinifilum sp. N1E240]
MNTKVLVAPSPHVHSGDSIQKNMYGVVFAMLPALLFSFFYFGLGALVVTLTAVASCYLFEFLISKYLLKTEPTINDGSALITGILLAFNVPSNLPIWIIIIGALVAIGIGKMTFGGLGNNLFNPALVGRVFLLISFPVQMTSWPKPAGLSSGYIDVETGATPLAIIKEGLKNGEPLSKLMGDIPSNMDLFLGNMGGSMGEIAGAALILGLIYMLIKKIITWHIPVSVIGTVAILSGILNLASPEAYAGPLFHILTGGLLLGAIFMATDYVTSPMSNKGMIIYGIGIGLLTVVIRVFGAYPEGVSFAILIMNAFVPLINVYVKPKRFGEKRK